MRRPVAVFGGAYILTQLAAVSLPPAAFLPLAAAFVCGCIIACACGKRGTVRILPAAILIGFSVQCIGFTTQVQPALALVGRRVDTLAEVVSAEPGFAEDTARVRLKLTGTDSDGRNLAGVLVAVDVFPDCEAGQRFRVSLLAEALEEDDYLYSSLADGVYLEAECLESPELAGESGSILYALRRFQQQFAANAARYLPGDEGGVLAAVASGDKSRLPDDVVENYRAAGISHLLVVSGLHLSLVCGVFATRSGGRFRRLRALAALGLVLFMMCLTGFTPSVLRAGVGALIFYTGDLFLLSADSLTSMGLAAVLISLQGPYAVCDLAFQLSFAAALGVVLAGGVLRSLRPDASDKKETPPLVKIRFYAADLLLPTVFAALFTLPVQLLGGLAVSGVSVLANLLALRLVGFCVVFGMLAGSCGFFPWLEFAARAFSLAGGLLAKLLNAIAAFCAALPLARLPLPREYTLIVLAAVGAVALCGWRLRFRRLACLAIAPLLLLGIVWAAVLQRDTVEIAVVGSAASPCVVAVQDRQAVVVFRGGDANAEQVREYLQSRGIERPQWVVDLRTGASSPPPEAVHALSLKDFGVNEAHSAAVCDIMTTAIRLRKGCLVVLDIRGYKIAVPSGTANTGTPVQVDLAVTGSAAPGNLRAKTLLTRMACDWQAQQQCDLYYAPRSARVLIRPGRAVVLRGGTYALQQDPVA